MTKKTKSYNFIDYLLIVITMAYVALTMTIWPFLSIGWFVIAIFTFILLGALYLSRAKHAKWPSLVGILIYLIFLEIYFYNFRSNLPDPGPFTINPSELNWGSAFFAFIVVGITPFFIAFNGLDLIANLSRSTRKTK